MADLSFRGGTYKTQGWFSLLLLTMITGGIYMMFWYYRINSELKSFGAAYGDEDLANSSPGSSVLAITLGAMLVIPALMSILNTGKRIQRASELAGFTGYSNGTHVLLMFITGLWFVYDQSALNSLWAHAEGQGEGAVATSVAA